MRKKSREMPAEWALEVFDKAPYITLAMTDIEGKPYCVPLSLVRTDEKTFYFHCAMEGKKLDALKQRPEVWLNAVTKCKPLVGPKDNSFTLEFQSAMAAGKAEIVESIEEKILAMRAICERFLPKHMDAFDASIERSLGHACVVKITLSEPPVGKRKQYDENGEEMKSKV